MKKTIAMTIAIMITLFVLTACTSEKKTPSESTSSAQDTSQKKETIPTEKPDKKISPKPKSDDDVIPGKGDPGDGEIGDGFVDCWYLFGDLTFDNLTINDDSAWELKNIEGQITANGTSVMIDGLLYLYSYDGDEVGFVELENDELVLVLTEIYEGLMEKYSSGELRFIRESASVAFETQ